MQIQPATTTTFKFSAINIDNIKEAIQQINSKGDIERITPQVLLDALPVTGELFCSIINESLHSGIFPEEMFHHYANRKSDIINKTRRYETNQQFKVNGKSSRNFS